MKSKHIIFAAAGFLALAACLLAVSGCSRKNPSGGPAITRDATIEKRVDSVLKKLTLEQKAGQMMQMTTSTITKWTEQGLVLDPDKLQTVIGKYKVGSILNTFGDVATPAAYTAMMVSQIQQKSLEEIGVPCIFGLDMIHGASYLTDGTFFPQEINLAATFNREYARAMGEAMAYETRAAMVPWVFSPVMDLGRNAVWPRQWESFGEDPFLNAEMATVETKALQGDDPNHIDLEHVAVSIKHYMAYGVPVSGKDRTPAIVPYNELREKYFRPFKECLQAGALTIMVNSASINGIPTHANGELLNGWVKEQLGWDGLIVTDWADIDNLYMRDHVAKDVKEALALGINAGIDMVMDPNDPANCEQLVAAVKEGLIPMSRVDDAVRRVLRLKFRLGLFEKPLWDVSGYDRFACEEFQQASYAAAVESEVLLKNEDNILPLEYGTRILVTGPNGNSMRTLNGGWSYTWQGDADRFAGDHNTIFEALAEKFGEGNVTYEPGVTYDERDRWSPGAWQKENEPQIARAVAAAFRANVIVACIGENSYCETPGNIDDLNLSKNQKDLVEALAKTGKPIILVLNEGRPRIIREIEPLAKAVIDVMLPGNRGGDALAALMCGEENFSGKLPFTYPKYVNSLHTYDYKVSEHRETMAGEYNYDAVMDVQWPFGAGLSYTEFGYSDFKCLVDTAFTADDVLEFEVTVTNKGMHAGKESVLLFSSDLVASLIPDVRRLRGFEKIELAAGESKTVSFKIPAYELAFVGADGKWRLEEGDFRMSCGGESLKLFCKETKVWDRPNID
ncbi:MAG: glycoside hydrolase family 3 C-terminal domain-containing protein [Bacteroidales bacterium]|nr:glycoside hydrolase family 3 C-terminal domain-containing protein [Bacteroidales bacterium]